MQLHRTTGTPDWETVPIAKRNRWQTLAARTHGVFTPGNIVTLGGLVLVGIGLYAVARQHYWLGLSFVGAGRLSDLLDGWLAESTGTKSPLGELLDAGADKLGTFATIIVFYTSHLAPWWIVTALLLPHVMISASTLIAQHKHRRLHPSQAGKISMALSWLCLVGFVLLRALHATHSLFMPILAVLSLATSLLGSYVAVRYVTKDD
jgi:phosphatidylglycerophosphate synthase